MPTQFLIAITESLRDHKLFMEVLYCAACVHPLNLLYIYNVYLPAGPHSHTCPSDSDVSELYMYKHN